MMLDRKVLAGFQWLVDESERQPAWWAEQAAWAGMVFGAVAYVLVKGSAVEPIWLGAVFLAGALTIGICRVPRLLSMIGSQRLGRMLFWVSLALRTLSFIVSPENWRAAYIGQEAMLLSFMYFAACQPPRPRRRRQVFAEGGAI